MPVVLGVDIGGTKVNVGAISSSGEVLESERRATGHDATADELIAAVCEPVAALIERHDVQAIGVGCAGPMEAGGVRVSPLNLPAWRNFPLAAKLSEFGLPVFVDNDVKVLARGEGWRGAATGCDDYLCLVVSTGIGGAVVSAGRVVDGASGNAGHIGHVIVEPLGAMCECGARGCVEAEASGTAIARRTGRDARYASAAEWGRSAELLGRALVSCAALTNPQRIVIGGGVALGVGQPYIDLVGESFRQHAGLSFVREARVLMSTLGPDGGALGAGALALARTSGGRL